LNTLNNRVEVGLIEGGGPTLAPLMEV
jgi:hypothetical protein